MVNNQRDRKDDEAEGNKNLTSNETKSITENSQDVLCNIAEKVNEDGKNNLDVSETQCECDSKKRVCSDVYEGVNEAAETESKRQKLENSGVVKLPDSGQMSSCAKSDSEKDSEITDLTDKNAEFTTAVPTSETSAGGVLDGESPKEYILKCVMRLKRVDDLINLELEWLDGQSRELMYQVKTFLQNRLKVEPSPIKK